MSSTTNVIRDLGIGFYVVGANAATYKLNRIATSLSRLTTSHHDSVNKIQNQSAILKKALSQTSLSAELQKDVLAAYAAKIETGGVGAATAMTGAFGAISAAVIVGVAAVGAALAGGYKTIQSGLKSLEDVTRIEANLRALGMDDQGVMLLRSHAQEMATEYAGVSVKAFQDAAYDIKSAIPDVSDASIAGITEVVATLARTTKMTVQESGRFVANLYGATKSHFKDMDPAAFAKMWASQAQKAVIIFRTNGHMLMESMKHSMAVLTEIGWKPSDILGVTGFLHTAGFSPENVGTAQKNIALAGSHNLMELEKSITGWNKMVRVNKFDKHETNELYEKARGEYYEELMKSPLTFYKKLSELKKMADAKAMNFKYELSKRYGKKAVPQMMVMLENIDQFKERLKEIEGAVDEYEQTVKLMEQMNKGYGPQLDLLHQRKEHFWQSIGEAFEGPATRAMQRIGQMFDFAGVAMQAAFNAFEGGNKATDKLMKWGQEQHGDPMYYLRMYVAPLQDIQKFLEKLGDSFARAFNVPDISGVLQKIADTLNQIPVEKIDQMVESFKSLAKLTFETLVEGLGDIGKALVNMAKISQAFSKPGGGYLEAVNEGLRQQDEEYKNSSIYKYLDQPVRSWLQRQSGGDLLGPMGEKLNFGNPALVPSSVPATPDASAPMTLNLNIVSQLDGKILAEKMQTIVVDEAARARSSSGAIHNWVWGD